MRAHGPLGCGPVTSVRSSSRRAEAGGRPAVDLPASVAGAIAALADDGAHLPGQPPFANVRCGVDRVCDRDDLPCVRRRVSIRDVGPEPPAMRYLRRGWQSFLSFRNFRRFPTLVPRALVSNLALQTFISRRGRGRWLAHQSLFWGVVLATCRRRSRSRSGGSRSRPPAPVPLRDRGVGVRDNHVRPVTWFGWLVFHALDVAAVLVLLGCAYFLMRRLRDREATTAQRLGYDFLPRSP